MEASSIMLHRYPKDKNDWTKMLHSALTNQAVKVPEDWLTSDQVGEQMGVNRAQATKFLKMLKMKDLVEIQYFRICVNDEYSIIREVAHYRICKKIRKTLLTGK